MRELSKEKISKLYETDFNIVSNLKNLTSRRYDVKNKKIIEPEFTASDIFTMEKNTLYNKEAVKTTVGRYIFNKVVLRDKILAYIGYQNKTITDSVYKKDVDASVAQLLQEDKITVEDFSLYLLRLENFTNSLINTQTVSLTENILVPNEKVLKKKKELFDKYRDEIESGNVARAVEIEHELVEYAKELLKDDPGMANYDSGARGSFASNYKEMNIMKGPVYNAREDRFDVIENSFAEGLAKKDLAAHGNAVSTGAYPKALGTAVSGYFSKQLVASLETIVLDKDKNTFCGTKKTLSIVIPEKIKKEFVGRVIKEGNRDVELTYGNIDKYAGKKVELYSPLFCLRTKSGGICGRCGDRRLLSLDITHIGIASNRLSSTMLNLKTKQWHNATVVMTYLEPDNLFFQN